MDITMDRKRLLKTLVWLMFLMFLANTVILKFHWYYTIWWVDMPMHFFAGFWVGLFFLYVFYTRNWFSHKILAIILSTLLIGVLWEFFEILMGAISHEPFILLDTISDIFFDLAGGTFAILYFFRKTISSTGNKV